MGRSMSAGTSNPNHANGWNESSTPAARGPRRRLVGWQSTCCLDRTCHVWPFGRLASSSSLSKWNHGAHSPFHKQHATKQPCPVPAPEVTTALRGRANFLLVHQQRTRRCNVRSGPADGNAARPRQPGRKHGKNSWAADAKAILAHVHLLQVWVVSLPGPNLCHAGAHRVSHALHPDLRLAWTGMCALGIIVPMYS